MNAKRIAVMILANVAAMESGRISWAQFSRVNAATWDLAYGDELPIIGTPAARRAAAVSNALSKAMVSA